MKKYFAIPVSIALNVLSLAGIGRADTTATQAIEHPVTTLHQHEVNSDSKNIQVMSQEQKEAKARLVQTKKDYRKSLKENGAESDVTKAAKDRYHDAQKEYHKYASKTAHAAADLKADTQKVADDKASQ